MARTPATSATVAPVGLLDVVRPRPRAALSTGRGGFPAGPVDV